MPDPRPGADPNRFAPAAPGEIGVVGPYRLLKELGKGGTGTTYLALDTRLNRRVALKVVHPHIAGARFLRDVRTAAQIDHDNVVGVYEADERDGVRYVAVQFLEGRTLEDYLRTDGPPRIAGAIHVGYQAALGLAAGHKFGLVHRGIGPANLWVEAPTDRIKVLDFGFLQPVGDEDRQTTSVTVRAPGYLSPEQIGGQNPDHRSDLFSLGAVLYLLCTGVPPFVGDSMVKTAVAVWTAEPVEVRSLNPAVPEALAELVHQLLAKNPNDRPQTADEVATRLRATAYELGASDSP